MVGGISSLAGVVLGAGIDRWRRGRADRKQKRRDLIHAGPRLATATTACRRAALMASEAQTEPQWRAMLDAHRRKWVQEESSSTSLGIPEVAQASLDIVSSIFAAADLSTAEGTAALARAQADVIKAYSDAVRKAKL
jgi:hypothetical protein